MTFPRRFPRAACFRRLLKRGDQPRHWHYAGGRTALISSHFLGLVLCWPLPRSSAEEPINQFLDALRNRGQHELALVYLDRLATSRLTPADMRDELDFVRGSLLLDQARFERDSALRRQRLAQAEQALEEFLQGHAQHHSALQARQDLANVLVERARNRVREAGPGGDAAALSQAHDLFARAYAELVTSQEGLAEALKSLPGGAAAEDEKQRRDSYRTQYIQTKLAAARVLVEQAATIKDVNPENRKQLLNQAADAFHDIAEKYRAYSAGLFALLYEAECHQQLGDTKKALSYYRELLSQQENSPPVRRLRCKALAQAMECWLGEPDGPALAITTGEEWLKNSRPDEERSADWLLVKLRLAAAYQKHAELQEKEKAQARELGEARRLAEEVARRANPHQLAAQTLLTRLRRVAVDGEAESQVVEVDAKTFEQARDAAKQALDQMKVYSSAANILQSRLSSITDEASRQELQAKLTEAQQKVDSGRTVAAAAFSQAFQLADEKTDINALNEVRYYVSFLHYSAKEYWHAATIAGFVAQRYPDSIAARECANIALAAHQQIYNELADEDAKQRQADRLARIAELILDKWSGQPEAENALLILLNVMVKKGDYDRALQFLANLPADSAQRAATELRVGQALWKAYVDGSRIGEADGDAAADRHQLESLRQKAEAMLSQGIERARAQPVDETLVRSALSLAQIYLDAGQPKQALDLLHDDKIGASTLVGQGHPVAKIPGFSEETYRTAIRANVSSVPLLKDNAQVTSAMEQAVQALDALREQVGDSPAGKQRLIAIYVSLAQDLQRQMAVAAPQARMALSQGFELFLQRAGEASNDAVLLNWVAETFYTMGKSLDEEGGGLGETARRYFERAAEYYRKILRDPVVAADQQFATQVHVRLATTHRRLGEYQQAMDALIEILSQRERILNIQIEAAYTLQEWGLNGQPEKLLLAMQGANPSRQGQSVVWGWGRIATVTGRMLSQNPQYQNSYHEARYNLAYSRYSYGKLTRKKDELEKAKRDVLITFRLYPKLGGARRKGQYEALLKRIQQELGEAPVGLAEIESST